MCDGCGDGSHGLCSGLAACVDVKDWRGGSACRLVVSCHTILRHAPPICIMFSGQTLTDVADDLLTD